MPTRNSNHTSLIQGFIAILILTSKDFLLEIHYTPENKTCYPRQYITIFVINLSSSSMSSFVTFNKCIHFSLILKVNTIIKRRPDTLSSTLLPTQSKVAINGQNKWTVIITLKKCLE